MELLSRQSPTERVDMLFSTWRSAPDDADIELRTGHTEGGLPCILVSIGSVDVPFSADEADAFAGIAGRHELPADFRKLIDAITRAAKASRLPTLSKDKIDG